ncbi:uncharacterized protein LACBIDRAFT_330996 [Laccaria bicolor S238N-H82]|uniref:Predicted protein n=1 Tax=Laccaria bicolor (strain S238N-H82 / ATCC MYA-4686) TaxID=486041 RepID=B0DMX5_LACBS|nr:uncharacterized protein LACBIDRAFT_330996 [Laccaria bicolor S238N-H82]EDR04050.1 predicted protein [Laccaria bicolor S238N-H82]|eukprot:XP_001885305.1 predicted protein [Laccaria bicolor S238N-H82]
MFVPGKNMLAYLGCLPSLVRIPAGGSLTAVQWLLMAVVVALLRSIPQIWHDYMLDPAAARRQCEAANKAHINKKYCQELVVVAQAVHMDDRDTVQALARDLEEHHKNASKH